MKKEIKFLKYRLFITNVFFIIIYTICIAKHIMYNIDRIFSMDILFLILSLLVMTVCTVKLFNDNNIFNIVKYNTFDTFEIIEIDVILSVVSIIIVFVIKFVLNLIAKTGIDTSIYYLSIKIIILWLVITLMSIFKYDIAADKYSKVKYKKISLIKNIPFTNEITEYIFLNEEEYEKCEKTDNKDIKRILNMSEYGKCFEAAFVKKIDDIIHKDLKEIIIYVPYDKTIPLYLEQYCNNFGIIINVKYCTYNTNNSFLAKLERKYSSAE